MTASKKPYGFTLIEVLVAIAIVATALPALLYTVMQQVDGTAYIRQRMIANWISVNKMTEWHVDNLKTGAIPELNRDGTTEMANSRWGWRVETESSAEAYRYRILVSVWHDQDSNRSSLSTIEGYLNDFEALLKEEGYIK